MSLKIDRPFYWGLAKKSFPGMRLRQRPTGRTPRTLDHVAKSSEGRSQRCFRHADRLAFGPMVSSLHFMD